MLRTALEGGFQDRILTRLITAYKERCQILCDVLASEPRIRVFLKPTGGYFVWVEFANLSAAGTSSDVGSAPEDPASRFARYCAGHGLKVMPGTKCDLVPDDFLQSEQPRDLCHNAVRLCFADMDRDDVEAGARRLIELYRAYVVENTGT